MREISFPGLRWRRTTGSLISTLGLIASSSASSTSGIFAENHQTLPDPLSDIFGSSIVSYRTNGMGLKDPRRILSRVKELKQRSLLVPVHGDLHPSNVLIDSRGFPALIDFAFAHAPAHYVKDFVLMECSVRLADGTSAAPDRPHGEGRRSADSASRVQDREILHPRGFHSLLPCRRWPTWSKRFVITVHHGIPRFRWREYLLSQYLILMGVIRLELYQDTRVLRALLSSSRSHRGMGGNV